jgi:phage shock protein PspC (stress-responsive transcriptional regulator)
MTQKRLTRTMNDKVISGVCGGLAKYFGLDTVFIRAAFLISILGFGTGFLLYIILWIVMPAN